MRILTIGPSPEVLGGVSYVIRLILKYASDGVEFVILPTLVPSTAAAHQQGNPTKYLLKSAVNLSFFVRSLARVRRITRTEHVDLAHIHFASYGSTFRKYFMARSLFQSQLPYLLHAHGASYREFYAKAPSFVKRRIQWMLRSAEGLIVLSESWRDFYQSLRGESARPIWVMPNPVELPEQWYVDASDTLKLLFLGRMDERKGGARVVQALACLPEAVRHQVRLYMAGDGDVEAVRRLAESLGLQAQVDIRHWIEGEEKQRWLQETNAFILPSRAEGLPMAMLEAMAYGKALIVSPVGGIPEFVTDGQEGILVPPDDIEAISRAIARLAEDPALRAQMGRAARKRVEPLDVKRYMQQLQQIYLEVLESVSSRSR